MLKQAAEYHFAWNDRITHDVVATYEREKSAYFFHGRDRQRRAIVTDLFNGVPTDTEQLGYNLKVDHLGGGRLGERARVALQSMATLFDASLLVVEGTGGTSLAWLGSSRLGESFERHLASVHHPRRPTWRSGDPNGLAGFRRDTDKPGRHVESVDYDHDRSLTTAMWPWRAWSCATSQRPATS